MSFSFYLHYQIATNSPPPQLQLLNDVDKALESVNSTAATAVRDNSPPPTQLQSSGDTAAVVRVHSPPDATPQRCGNNIISYLLFPHDVDDHSDSRFSHQSEDSGDDMDISAEIEPSAAVTFPLSGIFFECSFPLIKY
jgi:hypothetical protein